MTAPNLPTYERSFPADTRFVAVARREVVEVARRAGLEDGAVDDLALAVSEAVTNGVLHASGRSVGVRAEAAADVLHVTVTDDGHGMRPRLDSPGLGLGLTIMGRVCSQLRVEPGPGGVGTSVHLAFALPVPA